MNSKDFQNAMALYADADQRATASLIEMVAATVLRKLAYQDGDFSEPASVSLSPADLEETAHDFLVSTSYEDETMTVIMTPLVRK